MSKYSIGLLKETKNGEKRVALTPLHIESIIRKNPSCKVFVENDAGLASGFCNEDYIKIGATIVQTKLNVYENANLIIKVKEPDTGDLKYLTSNHALFSYLHLAAFPEITKVLLEKQVFAIAFESVMEQNPISFPLLKPMSTIAGKLAIHMAHDVLRSELGELIDYETNVAILGCGNVGVNAAQMAIGMNGTVHAFDNDMDRIQTLYNRYHNNEVMGNHITHLKTYLSDPLSDISIVVCGALIPNDKAPHLISKQLLEIMNGPKFRSTIFVDVSIDQGGCIEGIKPTSLTQPFYKEGKHYFVAVPNMPGSVPKTSSVELADAICPYVSLLVSEVDMDDLSSNTLLIKKFEALHNGIVTKHGKIANATLKNIYG